MGLLDQILAGAAGAAGVADRGPGGSSLGPGGGVGAGMGSGGLGGGILAALLPVVLGMLANRGSSGGGLGGTLGTGLGPGLGGSGGLSGMGGLGGLLDQFHRHGFGQQASSWVGTGANEPLTPDAVGQVLGADGVDQIAQQAGVSPEDARGGLAELLPHVVDQLTPDGQVPDFGGLTAGLDDYLNQPDR